jgi:hypothetical protein
MRTVRHLPPGSGSERALAAIASAAWAGTASDRAMRTPSVVRLFTAEAMDACYDRYESEADSTTARIGVGDGSF